MLFEPSKTAFIIEDDTDIRTLISVVLKMKGLNTIVADSIEAAKLLVPKIQPDMIFVDHRLPDGLGFEFIPVLRKQFQKSIIIAMTAQHSPDMETLSFCKGVDYYLYKPFQVSKLNDLIDSLFH